MTWAWLGPPSLDFGRPDDDETVGQTLVGERTIWLYADPYRVLEVERTAGRPAVQRAYRQVARRHHPDVNPGDAAALDRFHEVQHAYEAAVGEPEISVEPISGDWWTFSGFATPTEAQRQSLAVVGLRFELGELHRVPLRDAEDEVRISYAGQTLPLGIAHSASRRAAPLWRARAAVATEASLLLVLCLALFPIVALVLAANLYLLSGLNDVLAWGSALLVLAAGYGALAAILASGGRSVPYPRRAVGRTRAVVAEMRALNRHRPGRA